MRLPRPYIPISVRIKVAQRQLRDMGLSFTERDANEPKDVYLDSLLAWLATNMGGLFQKLQLDHDPALCNRKFSKRTGRYTPAANDTRYLIYRTTVDHELKTRVRGDGAQLSDLALRRKFKRIDKRQREGKR